MVYTEEKSQAQEDNIPCAVNKADEITVTDGAPKSVAEAQKACKEALNDVYAAMSYMHNSRW